jgi:hypothetical protein
MDSAEPAPPSFAPEAPSQGGGKRSREENEAAAPCTDEDGAGTSQGAADEGVGTSVEPAKVMRLLRKAETILAHRVDSLLLVLERPLLTDNYLG